jgi:hypothetical protein
VDKAKRVLLGEIRVAMPMAIVQKKSEQDA